MDESQREKYERLKKINREKIEQAKWRESAFFMEFLHSTEDAEMIPQKRCEELLDRINTLIPISVAGHIAWDKAKCGKVTVAFEELHKYIDTSKKYIIIWDDSELPAIKCGLQSAINNVDCMEAVSFSFLIVSEDFNVILESQKFGHVNLGILGEL